MGDRRPRLIVAALLLVTLTASDASYASVMVRGVVQTVRGTPVGGASVVAGSMIFHTRDDGQFALPVDSLPTTLTVLDAAGNAVLEHEVVSVDGHQILVIPSRSLTSVITVVASPSPARLSDTASSVQVLDRTAIASSAAATLDDVLRQVPGFTLFRRSGSRTANPTAQGVSLRGVGASGASRSLVLDDGVPLNDPFGGWIYWGSVPREAIERVEVVRGGASDLYGSGALAGVVGIVRRDPSRSVLSAALSAGDDDTAEASMFWSGDPASGLRSHLALDGFTTAGYIPVAPAFRGDADRAARSERWLAEGGVERALERGAMFARLSQFEEERDNGTALQVNDTRVLRGLLGLDSFIGRVYGQARVFAVDQDFHQTFSAVSDDRDSERLVRVQDVPARSAGATFKATGEVGRSLLSAGADVARVSGRSVEAGPPFTARSASGGEQTTAGVWVHDELRLSPQTSATLAVRADFWRSEQTNEAAVGAVRSDEAISPRVAIVHAFNDRWTATATGYRSFRAPTLNELYRGFRVGNVVTQPNGRLGPERLTGLEVGALWQPSGRTLVRIAAYEMTVCDPVANFTLSITPDLVTRQRRNLGETRTRGLELDAEIWRSSWNVSFGYLLSDAHVIEDGADAQLDGKRVPQIPRHQLTAQVGRSWNLWSAALQARWSDAQWEDDRNQLQLDDYAVLDLRIDRTLSLRLTAFFAAENVLDTSYAVGRAGVETLGQPRSLRVGMRYSSR